MPAATRRFAQRMTLALVGTVLLVVLVSLTAFITISALSATGRGLRDVHLQAAMDAERLRPWLYREVLAQRQYAADRTPRSLGEVEAVRAAFSERLNSLRTNLTNPRGQQLIEAADRSERDLHLALERESLAPPVRPPASATEGRAPATIDVDQQLGKAESSLDELVGYEQRQAELALRSAQDSVQSSQRSIALGAIATICIAGGLAILLLWRLTRSFESAQAAIRARERFLSFASEELRRPLSSLAHQLEPLRQTAHAEGSNVVPLGLSRQLDAASAHVARLTQLVNELLEASQLQKGVLELQREPVDLAELVREVEARLEREFAESGSAIVVQAHRSTIGLWDRARLAEVITHLLTNALRHGRGKVIRIAVEPGDPARLIVRDHGPGMSKDQLSHVFEAYEGGEIRHQQGNLGLGLFIVRRIVEAHGGHIRVESTPALGTTFIVELPRRPALPRPERRPFTWREPTHAS